MQLRLIGMSIILSLSISSTLAAASPICKNGGMPTLANKIENYDIIATNTAKINTAQAFSGQDLHYQINYKVTNRENKLSINHNTGLLLIKAARKDLFDITVTAKNACGSVSTTFNVQIDEEE